MFHFSKTKADVIDAVNSPINTMSKEVGKLNLAKESRSREKKSKTRSEVRSEGQGHRSHKKQISTDSEHQNNVGTKEKKYRGRPRARDGKGEYIYSFGNTVEQRGGVIMRN